MRIVAHVGQIITRLVVQQPHRPVLPLPGKVPVGNCLVGRRAAVGVERPVVGGDPAAIQLAQGSVAAQACAGRSRSMIVVEVGKPIVPTHRVATDAGGDGRTPQGLCLALNMRRAGLGEIGYSYVVKVRGRKRNHSPAKVSARPTSSGEK